MSESCVCKKRVKYIRVHTDIGCAIINNTVGIFIPNGAQCQYKVLMQINTYQHMVCLRYACNVPLVLASCIN